MGSSAKSKLWRQIVGLLTSFLILLMSITGVLGIPDDSSARTESVMKLTQKPPSTFDQSRITPGPTSKSRHRRDMFDPTPGPPYDYFNTPSSNPDKDFYHFGNQKPPNHKDLNDIDGSDDDGSGGNWQWCLLSIAGNKTIVQRRRKDFIHYLKMNVASLIGSDYERVMVNTVTYTPDLVVNVTLDWDLRERIVRVLSRVADDRDILLDLSGQHFNLTGFVPSSALLAPKPVAHLEADDNLLTAKQIESLVFTVVGVAIAFLLTASLLFGICHCAVTTRRRKLTENRMRGSQSASTNIEEEVCLSTNIINHSDERRYSQHSQQRTRGPNLIYSPGFSSNLTDGPQESQQSENGRYTPIDDSLAPLSNRYDEDPYIPRFILRSSNGTSAVPPPRRQLRFKREGLTDSEDDLAKLMSPNSETDTLLSWPQHNHHGTRPRRRDHEDGVPRRNVRRNPPYDLTLRPNSAFLYHPPPLDRSIVPKHRRASVQNYLDSDDIPTPVLSSFKSPPIQFHSQPPPKPTTEEIERDVSIVFRNMGLEPPIQYQNP